MKCKVTLPTSMAVQGTRFIDMGGAALPSHSENVQEWLGPFCGEFEHLDSSHSSETGRLGRRG